MTFNARISMKLSLRGHCLGIACTKFHRNRSRNVEIWVEILRRRLKCRRNTVSDEVVKRSEFRMGLREDQNVMISLNTLSHNFTDQNVMISLNNLSHNFTGSS